MPDPCDSGLCGSAVPPLIGPPFGGPPASRRLTGTSLTLAQASAPLERGEDPPLTPVQRRLVEAWSVGERG